MNGYRNNCEWIIFPLIVLKYLWMEIWSFIVLLWDSYSQVLWNSDWMQVQSMGDLAILSFSINKKRFAIFWQSSNFAVGEIRTRDLLCPRSAPYRLRYLAVDKDARLIGLFIWNMSPNWRQKSPNWRLRRNPPNWRFFAENRQIGGAETAARGAQRAAVSALPIPPPISHF